MGDITLKQQQQRHYRHTSAHAYRYDVINENLHLKQSSYV